MLDEIAGRVGGPGRVRVDGCAEAAVDEGELGAVFVVPDDFDSRWPQVRIGALDVISGIDSDIRPRSRRESPAATRCSMQQTQLSIATAIASGGDPGDVVPAAVARAGQSMVTLGEIEADIRQLDLNTQTVAGMAMFFLLFTAQAGFLSLLEERRDGTLARILSTPTPPAPSSGRKPRFR